MTDNSTQQAMPIVLRTLDQLSDEDRATFLSRHHTKRANKAAARSAGMKQKDVNAVFTPEQIRTGNYEERQMS
jgi:hypothetical protein